MSVAIPPSGTRGVAVRRMPGPLMSLMTAVIFRLFRNRRMMGVPILMLTTTGARSGQPRRSVPAQPDDARRARQHRRHARFLERNAAPARHTQEARQLKRCSAINRPRWPELTMTAAANLMSKYSLAG